MGWAKYEEFHNFEHWADTAHRHTLETLGLGPFLVLWDAVKTSAVNDYRYGAERKAAGDILCGTQLRNYNTACAFFDAIGEQGQYIRRVIDKQVAEGFRVNPSEKTGYSLGVNYSVEKPPKRHAIESYSIEQLSDEIFK